MGSTDPRTPQTDERPQSNGNPPRHDAAYRVELVFLAINDYVAAHGTPARHDLRMWSLLLSQAYDELKSS